jgi:hypothetical protein
MIWRMPRARSWRRSKARLRPKGEVQVLGPQRAPSKKLESDPEKVASFEPASAAVANWIRVALGAGMTALCLWLVLKDDVGLIQRWIVLVGGIFFAYATFSIARRANTRKPASFDLRGLWIDGPSSRKVIAWDNIESLSQFSVSSQKFNVIALKYPERLAEQYDVAEAKAALGRANAVAALGAAIGIGSSNASDLTAMFANRRRQYGGEVWLSTYDRDRDAEAFEALIKAWWNKYRGGENT